MTALLIPTAKPVVKQIAELGPGASDRAGSAKAIKTISSDKILTFINIYNYPY